MGVLTVPIHLRWRDMDSFGHINNVAYLGYLEDARIALLADGGYSPDFAGMAHMVVRHEIDYLHQLAFRPEPVEADIWIEKLGQSTYEIGYLIRDGDINILRGKTVMVCMNMESNLPGRIPAELRAKFEDLMNA
ncbi:MAG: thioesterase family protein [Actinomycetes bacterium]